MTYVLHPFFVVGATFLAQCRGMGPWVGAAFVCVAAIVTGFGAAHLIRRIRPCGGGGGECGAANWTRAADKGCEPGPELYKVGESMAGSGRFARDGS
ncbi:MAG: hypothetical protein ACLR8Y_00425 [Alistipes indistinctus]